MFNEQFKRIFMKVLPVSNYGYLPYILSGACAGSVETLINTPFEVIKVRMQSPAGKAIYRNVFQAAAKIVSDEGLKVLYVGGAAQWWRNWTWCVRWWW